MDSAAYSWIFGYKSPLEMDQCDVAEPNYGQQNLSTKIQSGISEGGIPPALSFWLSVPSECYIYSFGVHFTQLFLNAVI